MEPGITSPIIWEASNEEILGNMQGIHNTLLLYLIVRKLVIFSIGNRGSIVRALGCGSLFVITLCLTLCFGFSLCLSFSLSFCWMFFAMMSTVGCYCTNGVHKLEGRLALISVSRF